MNVETCFSWLFITVGQGGTPYQTLATGMKLIDPVANNWELWTVRTRLYE